MKVLSVVEFANAHQFESWQKRDSIFPGLIRDVKIIPTDVGFKDSNGNHPRYTIVVVYEKENF
jgi:hypothetical protein